MTRRSVVLFGIISIGIGVLLKSIKGFLELFADVVELLVVVGGITSGNEVIEGLVGFPGVVLDVSLELCPVDFLLGPPLLGIGLEVFIDEPRGICASLEDILLESLEGGTINDLAGVCSLDGGSGS